MADAVEHCWSCKKLGGLAVGAASWVAAQCSADGVGCRSTKCCQSAGNQCFAQGADWASCKYECNPGKDAARSWEPAWCCEALGGRTPGSGTPAPKIVASWVSEKCSWDMTDCKNQGAATRGTATSPSAWRTIRQAATPSATTRLGVVSNRARTAQSRPGHQGFAFAVCWSLSQPTCYEMAVIRNQFLSQCHSDVIIETLQTCWRKLRIISRRRASRR